MCYFPNFYTIDFRLLPDDKDNGKPIFQLIKKLFLFLLNGPDHEYATYYLI